MHSAVTQERMGPGSSVASSHLAPRSIPSCPAPPNGVLRLVNTTHTYRRGSPSILEPAAPLASLSDPRPHLLRWCADCHPMGAAPTGPAEPTPAGERCCVLRIGSAPTVLHQWRRSLAGVGPATTSAAPAIARIVVSDPRRKVVCVVVFSVVMAPRLAVTQVSDARRWGDAERRGAAARCRSWRARCHLLGFFTAGGRLPPHMLPSCRSGSPFSPRGADVWVGRAPRRVTYRKVRRGDCRDRQNERDKNKRE